MADETPPESSNPPPDNTAVETRARSMGWVPKEQWHGNPANWQPASEYVDRAEQVMPYLRTANRKQEEELQRLREQTSKLQNDLRGATDAINTLQSFKGDVQERLESADEAALAQQLAEARDAKDTVTEVRLLRKLAELDNKRDAAPPPKKDEPPPPPPAVRWEDTDDGRAFIAKNPWWNDDRRMRAVAIDIGQELAQQGRLNGLTPAQRGDLIAAETLKYFNRSAPPQGTSKVESGRPSSAGNAPEGEHSFTDLPPEAREACKRQTQWLVGPGKRFKTEAEWQKHYVAGYFTDSWGSLREGAR